jgi:hypothetical protein
MSKVADLIKYHQENEYLDFKKEEYTRANRHELIMDVLAFANAAYEGSRFIIIGVKKDVQETLVYNIENPTDSASIQQLIHTNITPELDVSYYPYTYDDKNLMVLEIKNPCQKPYFPNKKIEIQGKTVLKEGSSLIRKGSYKCELKRSDLEDIYLDRSKFESSFEGLVSLTFLDSGSSTIKIQPIDDHFLPSKQEARNIRSEMTAIENELVTISEENIETERTLIVAREIRISELKDKLVNVENDFKQKDIYYVGELGSYKMQLTAFNGGKGSIEDATLIIETPVLNGLCILDKPVSPLRMKSSNSTENIFELMHYPEVKDDTTKYTIKASVGNIKHKIDQELLKIPLRVVLLPSLKEKLIKFTCTLHGTNLPDPMKFHLEMEIV